MLLPLAGWVLVAGLGAWPTWEWFGSEGLQAMAIAQVIVVVVTYGTLVPAMRRMPEVDTPARLVLAMKAGVWRLGLTVLLSAAMAWLWPIETKVFLVWVAIAYLVLISFETSALVLWAKKLESQACS